MIDVNEVRRLFHYDPNTGILTWAVDNKYIKGLKGQQAGSYNRDRLAVNIKGKSYKVHRLCWLYFYGEWPNGSIDHKDGKSTNNRIENLRVATHKQNMGNARKRYDNRTGFKGVSYSKGYYKVMVAKQYYGQYGTPEEAYEIYKAVAKRIYGEFARFE